MAQKAITIYTPAGAAAHIFAEDDAQVHRALIGESGITLADQLLACSVVDNNTVSMAAGCYSNQGYLIVVQGGTTAELPVASGTVGAFRHDLVIADFIRGGGDTPDSHVFRVLKGSDAASDEAAQDPALVQDDLTAGGSERQEAVFRIRLNGTQIASIDRVANYIGNVYQ